MAKIETLAMNIKKIVCWSNGLAICSREEAKSLG